MENQFNLKKFLVENKLTTNSKVMKEESRLSNIITISMESDYDEDVLSLEDYGDHRIINTRPEADLTGGNFYKYKSKKSFSDILELLINDEAVMFYDKTGVKHFILDQFLSPDQLSNWDLKELIEPISYEKQEYETIEEPEDYDGDDYDSATERPVNEYNSKVTEEVREDYVEQFLDIFDDQYSTISDIPRYIAGKIIIAIGPATDEDLDDALKALPTDDVEGDIVFKKVIELLRNRKTLKADLGAFSLNENKR